MNEPGLEASTDANGILTLTLNRPHALNALDHGLLLALRQALAGAASARAVVLRGAGRSFCGGGDVLAMQAHQQDLPAFVAGLIDTFHACVLDIARLPVPVLACVHGAVAGGGISLALACDFVLADRGTRFVVAYPQLGAPADGGLSFALTQRLGPARALETLTVHGDFDAPRALAWGLVNALAEDEDCHALAQRWASALARLPPQPVGELKRLVGDQRIEALRAHLDREKAAFLRCAATDEFRARVARFAARA